MRLSGFNLPWSTIWMLILKFLFRLTLAQSFHMLFEVVGDIPIPSTAFTDNRTMYFMHGPKLTYLNIVLVGLNKKTLSTRECEIINTENTTTNTHFITHERICINAFLASLNFSFSLANLHRSSISSAGG
jgi:hypothetical protein